MKVCPKCGKQYPDDANFCPLDAGMLVADTQPKAKPPVEAVAPAVSSGDGSRVVGNRFKLDEQIGGGLTGEVYRAVDNKEGTECVVKLVDASVFSSSFSMQRSERELRQLVRLDSPGIAKVYGHGKDGDTLWIATELVAASQSLHERVFDDGPMEITRASRVVLAVGQALADAAKMGVIHRDLSPKNILLGPGDAVKIINFGVAVPGTGKVPGVPEFVAPEMVEGKPVDQRANIYSLGAVFYYLLTGRPPYMGEPEEVLELHLSGTPEPPSEHAEELPEVADAVVLKALERSSSKRFMTLRQFLSAVEHLAQGNFELINPAVTQPLGRSRGKGKKRQLSQTMLGYGAASRATGEQQAITAGEAGADSPGSTQKLGAVASAGTHEQEAPAETPSEAPSEAPASAGSTQPMGSVAAPAQSEPAAPAQSEPAAASTDSPAPGSDAQAADAEPAAAAEAPRAEAEPPRDAGAAAPQSAEPVAPAAAAAAPRAASQDAEAAAPARADQQGEPKKRRRSDGRFRETMWFKKGELDAAAAEEAEHDSAAGQGSKDNKAELLPIEDRYSDDGSITSGDRQRFSLKTGATESMPAYRDAAASRSQVSDKELINEMKGGRSKIIGLIVAGVLVVLGVAAALMLGGEDQGAPDQRDESTTSPEPEAPTPDPSPQ